MNKMNFLIVLFFVFTLSNIYAHPHIYIKPSMEVIIDSNMVKGITLAWEWDKWWSEDVINECDKDKNNKLNKKEINLVYKDFFSHIKDYNYFSEIFFNEKIIKISGVKNFSAKIIKKNIVKYTFTIPINKTLNGKSKLELCINDETLFIAFDKKLGIMPNKNYQYDNLKIRGHGYYGIQIEFDIQKKDKALEANK